MVLEVIIEKRKQFLPNVTVEMSKNQWSENVQKNILHVPRCLSLDSFRMTNRFFLREHKIKIVSLITDGKLQSNEMYRSIRM